MWIIKIGGSLAAARELRSWCTLLGDAGRGRVLIVPGGGPLANQVRRLQRRLHFTDRIAHRMALRAMDQFGLLLSDLAPGLEPVADVERIPERIARGVVPVWLPTAAVDLDCDIPASWDVTADSLAHWLAVRLGARGLGLLKSVGCDAAELRAADLVRDGIVDRAFPRRLDAAPIPCVLLRRADTSRLRTALITDDWSAFPRILP
ncbi:MAG: hypothetical protein IT495_03635 [Gammaproteobacteria bacterium]|nr:hypothetical protein [Gammaproteobacteria bacterium]